MLMLNISRVSIMILSVEVNAAELEEEDCRHQLQVNMGELPDQRIYGLFVAMDNAVTIGVGVGWRYLTAVTKKALGTQRGPSNSVRARYESLQVDAGPAAAAMLSPGPLKPPTCKKMNDKKPAAEQYNKKPVAELYYEKPAKEQYYEKPAAKQYYEKPAPDQYYEKPAVEHYYKKPAEEPYCKKSAVGRYETNRKKKLPQQGALCPPRCPDGSVEGGHSWGSGRLRFPCGTETTAR